MDASRTPTLLAAITEMAHCFAGITPGFGDVFAAFNCGELDSIATVLAIAGLEDTAACVIARHAEGDEYDKNGESDEDFDAHADIAREIDNHNGESWHADVLAKSGSYVKGLLAETAVSYPIDQVTDPAVFGKPTLRDAARRFGVQRYAQMTKADLVEALEYTAWSPAAETTHSYLWEHHPEHGQPRDTCAVCFRPHVQGNDPAHGGAERHEP